MIKHIFCIHHIHQKRGEKKEKPDEPHPDIFPIIQRGLRKFAKGQYDYIQQIKKRLTFLDSLLNEKNSESKHYSQNGNGNPSAQRDSQSM